MMRLTALAAAFAALAVLPAQSASLLNDYPTETRADYVFACMAVNGQTRDVLARCSCSIDVIASIMPYDSYLEAETILSMRQTGGEKTAIFRNAPFMREIVSNLRRAQAEAEIRCF
jgi:lysyl-tRNA synthetase class II